VTPISAAENEGGEMTLDDRRLYVATGRNAQIAVIARRSTESNRPNPAIRVLARAPPFGSFALNI
jgi:hypothetical protein